MWRAMRYYYGLQTGMLLGGLDPGFILARCIGHIGDPSTNRLRRASMA